MFSVPEEGQAAWTLLLGHSSKGSVRLPVTTHKSLWMGNDAGWSSGEAWEKCGPWCFAGRPPTKTAQLGHYKRDPHPHSYLRARLLGHHLLERGIACLMFL